jgi:hypothetical protein
MMEAAQAAGVPIVEKLRNIKIGSYAVDHGGHSKHIPVKAVCEEAAKEIENLKGECLLLADVLRDAFEVIKTIEGEDTDESDKLTELRLAIAYALALYDDQRIPAKKEGDQEFEK